RYERIQMTFLTDIQLRPLACDIAFGAMGFSTNGYKPEFESLTLDLWVWDATVEMESGSR
ncbi:MAG: hypothetical protein QGH72_07945, partial [Dehalococcoidia bacterium]|nr:hypothetical protein [Dehalococcoidia bacterium]